MEIKNFLFYLKKSIDYVLMSFRFAIHPNFIRDFAQRVDNGGNTCLKSR